MVVEINLVKFKRGNYIMNEIKEESIRKKIRRLYGDMSARKKRFFNGVFFVLAVIVLLKGFLFLEERVSREVYQLCILLVLSAWGLGLLLDPNREKYEK